jgi:hypothetical protein
MPPASAPARDDARPPAWRSCPRASSAIPATLAALGAVAALAAAAPAAPAATACARPGVGRALGHAVAYARNRFHEEWHGLAAHVALRRAAADRQFVQALTASDLTAARAEANRLLIGHLVRLRVVRGSRVLVDANSSSFAVPGPSRTLRTRRGRVLGQLTVTVQDVIGFVKLVQRHGGGYAVVRGQRGQLRTTLAAVPSRLPRSGCTTVAGTPYAVRSFPETSFSGEPLTVWVLVAAA